MTRFGFTGTRSLPDTPYNESLEQFLTASLPAGGPHAEVHEFTTGACTGFDAYVAEWALNEHPRSTHRLIVPANRSQVEPGIINLFANAKIPGWVTIEFMPDGTDYRARNARILDYTDTLIVCADRPEHSPASRRSGTWMTYRMAKKREIPTFTTILNEVDDA